jgi:hypothetical protein
MDVLSSIRNMCGYFVTGSVVVPGYREPTLCVSLLAPISYTRCEDELFAVSVFFPRRHSVHICSMLFLIESVGLDLHIYDKAVINFASFLTFFHLSRETFIYLNIVFTLCIFGTVDDGRSPNSG